MKANEGDIILILTYSKGLNDKEDEIATSKNKETVIVKDYKAGVQVVETKIKMVPFAFSRVSNEDEIK